MKFDWEPVKVVIFGLIYFGLFGLSIYGVVKFSSMNFPDCNDSICEACYTTNPDFNATICSENCVERCHRGKYCHFTTPDCLKRGNDVFSLIGSIMGVVFFSLPIVILFSIWLYCSIKECLEKRNYENMDVRAINMEILQENSITNV